jgi:hypothetical protein
MRTPNVTRRTDDVGELITTSNSFDLVWAVKSERAPARTDGREISFGMRS